MTARAKYLPLGVGESRRGEWPALLSYGFRPFFLLGALYAGLVVLAWLPIFSGTIETSSTFTPVDWHVHETMFGYLAAIITGFLLTAIPNWTGRLPVRGAPLLALVLLWLAGRFAVFFSAEIGWIAAAIIDCAFLVAVAASAAKEIVAGRNWRNLMVLVPVTVFLLANVLFHVEAGLGGSSDYARRLAIGAAVMLIVIIGGRIIPSFTRNWMVRENPGRLPVPFNRFDKITLLICAIALLLWTVAPDGMMAGLVLCLAGVLHLARLARWAGDRTLRDPLVLILHLGYLFVPAGLLLAGISALDPASVPAVAALHAFGVGAIGTMTLAVMTRATLGHTGRDLRADVPTRLIYAAIVLAALARIIAAFMPDDIGLLHLSAGLWALAFFGFCLRYGGMLLQPKLKPRQPSQPPGRPA
ncbi:NnrS family protein [Aquamicrobium sp.]|uniref:NnrS family protein n=1 Tax=Aquamicrobium sp. TaxID=1872579 RepID=UPI00258876B2|nr:NnrS family protein [Aquamicrobium sp.]MCK9553917.1 NnrS family protein [Aquamicrobium sp.]